MIATPDSARPAPSGSRRYAVLAIKLAVSGGLLAWLFAQVDLARLWQLARTASPSWLVLALALYLLTIIVGAWRWQLLLDAQGVSVPRRALANSFLVATFFNNFLPSNIGGDVIRITDTARAAGSRTLAATVVLIDRGVGLLALGLIAATGASLAAALPRDAALPVAPALLWIALGLTMVVSAPAVIAPAGLGRVLRPLRVFHPEWVGERILRVTGALTRIRARPSSLAGGFAGAVIVQAILVLFYVAIARSMAIPVAAAHLAVLVPVSFLVQMLPLSVNGFGVREATFGFYFTRIGLPLESALAVSFMGAALVMIFSLSGAVAYLRRRG